MVEIRRRPENAKDALASRRVAADARAKDHIDILQKAAAMRRHEATAAALQRILLRGTRFLLDRWADLVLPQPWAIGLDGALLGHLLTVDDAVFDEVAEECWVEILTLPEALDWAWGDVGQRSLWSEAYTTALRALADSEARRDKASRDRAELGKLAAEPRPYSDDDGQGGGGKGGRL